MNRVLQPRPLVPRVAKTGTASRFTDPLRKSMAVARGEGADQAATRRCRLSEPPETIPMPVCRFRTPQPTLRSAVVFILLVSISPSASNAPSASVARSAPIGLRDACPARRCLRLQGGGGSRGRGAAADVPGQVRPPILTQRTWLLGAPQLAPPSCDSHRSCHFTELFATLLTMCRRP